MENDVLIKIDQHFIASTIEGRKKTKNLKVVKKKTKDVTHELETQYNPLTESKLLTKWLWNTESARVAFYEWCKWRKVSNVLSLKGTLSKHLPGKLILQNH